MLANVDGVPTTFIAGNREEMAFSAGITVGGSAGRRIITQRRRCHFRALWLDERWLSTGHQQQPIMTLAAFAKEQHFFRDSFCPFPVQWEYL
jgi:hypothetical protein